MGPRRRVATAPTTLQVFKSASTTPAGFNHAPTLSPFPSFSVPVETFLALDPSNHPVMLRSIEPLAAAAGPKGAESKN
jgi:hypothetical protein